MKIDTKLIKHIKPGEKAHWIYGLIYWDICTAYAVMCPMPFNLIIRWFRYLYFWVKIYKPTELEILRHRAYIKGCDDGFDKGYERGLNENRNK